MRYRSDVDGLRAIAVLSVILFHIDKRLLPGGFVGVDVFFVISGFLITGNIAAELERGRFSIVEFYRRRVKRIAPAMLVVVACTLLASQALLLPEDARTVAKSAIWSLLSMANVYFWLYQDNGYFAADTAEAPLLHLWSLGVEEQFYIVWPLVLWALYRPAWRKGAVVAGGVAVAVASFALASAMLPRDPSFAYYMLPTRAGELLLGALAAIVTASGMERKIPPRVAAGFAPLGLAALAASLALLSGDVPFPGWSAVPATLGTALLILAGVRSTNPVSTALSARPLVAVGLVSYYANILHWPLLAIYRYGYGEVGPAAGATILVATLGLAWLTYRFVEQPARRSTASALRVMVQQYVLPAGALFVVGLVLVYPDRAGISLSSAGYKGALDLERAKTQPAFFSPTICQRQSVTARDLAEPRCVQGSGPDTPPQALLWGDSNAAHYAGMLGVFAREAGFRFRNVEVGSCPPVFADPRPFVLSRRYRDCVASLPAIRTAMDAYPVVIVSAAWSGYHAQSDQFLPSLFATVGELARRHRTVILLGQVPVMKGYDRRCREKALSFPRLNCPGLERPVHADIQASNTKLRAFAANMPNVRYFDAVAYLCPAGRCVSLDSSSEPRYFDESHLTQAASIRLGEGLVAQAGVPAPFRDIAGMSAPAGIPESPRSP